MKTNRFSIDDLVILKEDECFDNDNLSAIMGGMTVSCTCKCVSGNCYNDMDSSQKGD